MKKLFTIILACFSLTLSAQNFVMNPSFETISACPNGPSEFLNATNWLCPFNNVVGDTCSTSDLYNSCSPFGCLGVGVPCNILGNEPAHTGNGYAGVISYEGFALLGCGSLFGSGWREYVEAQFTSPLVAGQTYCISFYISLADNVKFATDNFGVYVSVAPISVNCTTVGASSALQPLGYTPQLTSTAGAFDTVTVGWTLKSWSYVATGGELYMTIGNFNDDGGTNYTCVDSAAFNPYAYYYIDDVSIVPGTCGSTLSTTTTQTNNLCNAACAGTATATPAGGAAPYTYSWTNGQTTQMATGLCDGTYTVTVTDAGSLTATSTVTITSSPFTATASPDTSVCPGTSVILGAAGGDTYSWSTSASTDSITVTAEVTATYTVVVSLSGAAVCADTLSMTVTVYPAPSSPAITQGGDTLYATPGFSGYQWYDGSNIIPGATNSYYVATHSGNYNLVVTDANGCQVGAGILNVVAGMNQLNAQSSLFSVFPNPSNGNFTIRNIADSREIELAISNDLGQVVYSKKLSGKKQYDIHPNLSKGIYVLELRAGDKKMIEKLIIE